MADWKKELKDAYDKSAAEKVNESNQSFRKEMAQANANALSKGMGRSSYAAQTVANLGTDMEEAGNRIRTDFDLEYLKALQQREMEEAQLELERQKLAEQKRQFDLQMSASAAGGGGGGYGGYSGSSSTQKTTNDTPQNNTNWWNVINSYEQKKTQSYVNTPGKATYSPTGLANVGLGKYATRTTR